MNETPVISLNDRIFMKLEYLQVGGSHKSRAAKRVVADTEAVGLLKRDGKHVILEKSGGNFGIGLAVHAIPLGYDLKLLVRPSFSALRRKLVNRLGAELIGQREMQEGRTNQEILELYTRQLSQSGSRVFFSDQFNNPSCIAAHEDAAREFVAQLMHAGLSKSDPVTLIKCAGSAASLRAYGSVFASCFPKGRIVVAQPAGCDFEKGVFTDHPFEGASVGLNPPFLADARVDEYMAIGHEEALDALDELFSETGSFVGKSTGLVFAAAKKVLATGTPPIAMLAYDAGEVYFADVILKATADQRETQANIYAEAAS